MRKVQADMLVRDAKRTSRKMGATLYSRVIDPNTGETTIVERWHHGIPWYSSGYTSENALAATTGVLSVASLAGAAFLNERSKIGNDTRNKAQAAGAVFLASLSALGFVSLMPFGYEIKPDTKESAYRQRILNEQANIAAPAKN